ncbi:hypothetical protein Ddye_028033 [Dipteronia dyeriana]|uniref:DDE Tnp4 domain-containing protein n=1 Tax=Dipteronia dyeriana TaxID=168575 RepID=A0AAD9WRZ6_9ROSI|nr:hypothetical protein Ddye_028013 [Dipteronia dyeriana]KAK2640238.1 hypothetical protein Ddye_028033 [Dipteronia dyeriana]
MSHLQVNSSQENVREENQKRAKADWNDQASEVIIRICVDSSLRCTIERTFGVWKNSWKILRQMPKFPFNKQVKIVIDSMVLHNVIRLNAKNDEEFKPYDDDRELLPPNEEEMSKEQDSRYGSNIGALID